MNLHEYLPLVGRLLIGLPFIYFGFAKAITPAQTLQGIKAVGLPLAPLAFLGAVSLEMIGGALLVLGYQVTVAALLLAAFSIVTAVFYHRNLADQNSLVHFLKNVMMAGGLVVLAGFGSGPLGLDGIAGAPLL